MTVAEDFRDRRKAMRTHSPAGQMPANWDQLTNAQRGAFTQQQRVDLRDGDFLWAGGAPEHGVWNTYNNWFCRCPPCRSANATRKADDRNGGTPMNAES